MYELLDPETKVQRFDSRGILCCTTSFLSTLSSLCVSLEICPLHISLQYYTGVHASRLRLMDGKLRGGREKDAIRRTTKRYDDDGGGKYVGLRLPLFAAVVMAARAPPPQTSRRRQTKKRGAGRKYSQLCDV